MPASGATASAGDRSSGRQTWLQRLSAALAGREQLADPARTVGRAARLFAASVCAAVFAWAYWPTFVELVEAWNREPDYSHGFLFAPLCVYFLWARREGFPGLCAGFAWSGLVLIAVSVGIRYLGSRWYLGSVDGWSMIPWLIGAVWLFCGLRVMWWCLPAILYLVFMVPVPFRLENALSLPLQRIATNLSTWTLQLIGQPALSEGNTIWLAGIHMEVEQACSGLRIFVSIIALAFAYIILVRQSWWERGCLLMCVVPIALVANATRIVLTGLLYQYASDEAAMTFSHDVAGWLMILWAAVLFALSLGYLRFLVRQKPIPDAAAILDRPVATQSS